MPIGKTVSGLYVSSMEWDSVLNLSPYIISEDARYVMGPSYEISKYLPIPWKEFTDAIQIIEQKGTHLNYKNMHESIDRDSLEGRTDNSSFIYSLMNNCFIRIRKDTARNHKGIHTMLITGLEEDIIASAKEIEIPRPFDKAMYPFREQFIDSSRTIEVLI